MRISFFPFAPPLLLTPLSVALSALLALWACMTLLSPHLPQAPLLPFSPLPAHAATGNRDPPPGYTDQAALGYTVSPRGPAGRPISSSAARAGQGSTMGTPDSTGAVVVYVTVPNKETGQKLARGIIENKLAACVNRIPGVESTYFWEGKVETSEEQLLVIKTRQSLLDQLSAHVKGNHPYDLPEFIALPITGGSEPYLKWIEDNTKGT